MNTHYNDLPVRFAIGDTDFSAINFVYERFQRTVPLHFHGSGSYEIHYISAGYGHAVIDGGSYELSPGCLYVTGPRVSHAQSPSPEDPMCEYCIYFKTEKKKRRPSASMAPGTEAFLSTFGNTAFWFGREAWRTGELIVSLFQELEKRRTGSEIQMEALLKLLLVRLVRSFEKGSRETGPKKADACDKTSVIIEEYFLYQYAALSLEELSGKLGMSCRQTQRLLRKQYGQTFLQKKTEARMSAAAILLADTDGSITSIADSLGYSSIEHFSSAFKNYYHITPRQYRKNAKKGAAPPADDNTSALAAAPPITQCTPASRKPEP